MTIIYICVEVALCVKYMYIYSNPAKTYLQPNWKSFQNLICQLHLEEFHVHNHDNILVPAECSLVCFVDYIVIT